MSDYRGREPVDAPRVINFNWWLCAGIIGAWMTLGVAVYAVCVALGLAFR
jgi:hypothetical protein